MRRLFVLLIALAAGCGTDPSPVAQPAGTAVLPTGGPIAAVASERQRLSTAQLLTYFPEAAGALTRERLGSIADLDTRDRDGTVVGIVSTVTVVYDHTEQSALGVRIGATIRDMIDDPSAVTRARTEFDQKTYAGSYDGYDGASFVDGTAAGLPTQEITHRNMPMLRLIIADRFLVQVGQTNGPGGLIDMADLVAFVEASPLPQLAEAPAFADAGTPPIPDWAAAAVAASEAATAERTREQEAAAAETAAETAAAGDLLPCDEILPAADVARVLGVGSVRVRPTPGVEVAGRNCNRSYNPDGGPEGVVLLIISHYVRAEQAESALRVASDHEGKLDLEPLAGGLTGIRYTHRHSFDTHVSHFAIGTDFVELKAEAPGEPAPGITPTQLAEITAIVARRLGG